LRPSTALIVQISMMEVKIRTWRRAPELTEAAWASKEDPEWSGRVIPRSTA